jgi:hypothetical protein
MASHSKTHHFALFSGQFSSLLTILSLHFYLLFVIGNFASLIS